MGLSFNDFYDLTPRQFYNICRGRQFKAQQELQGSWELARMGWLFSLQPHSKKKLTVKEVMVFPWEEKSNQNKKKYTKADLKETFAKWDKAKIK